MKERFGGTLLLVGSSVMSAFLAMNGAEMAGMKTAESFAPLLVMPLGFGVNVVVFLILVLMNQRAVLAALIAMTAAFLSGVLIHYWFCFHYTAGG